jgi:hypothetical protein
MYQRIRVDEFHSAGSAINNGFIEAKRLRRRIDEHWAYALAAAEHAIAQCFVKPCGMEIRCWQTCAQLLLGARLPGPQLLGELRVPRNVCGISHELRSGFFVRFERGRLEFIARSTAGFAQKNFDLLFSLRQRGLTDASELYAPLELFQGVVKR